jgi:hypothetical protein
MSFFGSGGGGASLSGGTANRFVKWTDSDSIENTSWSEGSTAGAVGAFKYVGASNGTAANPLIQLDASVATGLFISPDAFNRLAFCVDGVYCAEFTGGANLRLYDGTGQNNGTYLLSNADGFNVGHLAAAGNTFKFFVGSAASAVNFYLLEDDGDVMFNITKSKPAQSDGGQLYMNGAGTVPSGGSASLDQIDFLNVSGGGGISIGGVYKRANAMTCVPRLDWTGVSGTTTVNASTAVVGSSTKFEYQFGVGDYVAVSSAASTFRRITAITDATNMTVNGNLGDGTSQTFVRKQAPLNVKDKDEVGAFYVSPYRDVVIGAAGGAALATDASNGFLFIPSCAGTPTGTPETYTGRVAMVYDSSNNKLYVYDGGWTDVTGA